MNQELELETAYRQEVVAKLHGLAKKYKAQDKDMSVTVKKPLISGDEKKVLKHLRNKAVVVD